MEVLEVNNIKLFLKIINYNYNFFYNMRFTERIDGINWFTYSQIKIPLVCLNTRHQVDSMEYYPISLLAFQLPSDLGNF